jgi:hypothetical protein
MLRASSTRIWEWSLPSRRRYSCSCNLGHSLLITHYHRLNPTHLRCAGRRGELPRQRCSKIKVKEGKPKREAEREVSREGRTMEKVYGAAPLSTGVWNSYGRDPCSTLKRGRVGGSSGLVIWYVCDPKCTVPNVVSLSTEPWGTTQFLRVGSDGMRR